MEVTETVTEGLKREFKVIIAAADIDVKVAGRLNELAPTLNMPGFRPGKVPTHLAKKRFGQAVLGEVVEQTVNESSLQALEDRGLRPALQPQIEITSFNEGQDLEFSLSVELMPEIEPIDFANISLERLVAEPGETELEEALNRLANQHKSSEPITKKRASKKGDVVVIDFEGTVDGEVFEGGSAEGHHLELGSNQFIPGFEEQLIGLKISEEADVKVTFPDQYSQSDLAGKDAVFKTKLTEIREPVPVKIDDDFAKLFGMDDLTALKDALKTQLEQEFSQASRSRLKRSLLDVLEEGKAFDVPPGMADQEYQSICQAIRSSRPNSNVSEDHDHDHEHDHEHDHDHEHPSKSFDEELSEEDKKEYRGIAERRVRLGLMLQEVGRLNNIEVTEEELRRAMLQEASRYPGQEQQIMELYQKNPQAMASIRAPIFEDKIVDFITEMASVTDKKVTAAELLSGPDGEEESDSQKTDT